ncbi:unnamed protein product [Ilex paraguariensis]|uniref:HTH myb-type domain-containing protein n=1 Tax=Ilex paraguariensis TaxID=185542 RepID=A0ABC8V5M4_9AQUA
MREDDSNWFSKWEEELPSPEELMPLSQTLITPDLAMAFDIRNSNSQQTHQHQQPPPPPPPPPLVQTTPSSQPHNNNSVEFDSGELGGGGAASGDEPARTLKRPRLVWTPQLHKRFVDAVAHLGIKNAVPKTIMQLMSVDGLTRENVASHLQKYRLYLKRMQGLSSNGGGGGGGGIPAAVDPATDHLFASSPVPAHFVNLGRPTSDHFLPFVPVAALQQHHHHHHQQMAAVAGHPQFHPQYRPMGHFGSPPNGQFELPFLSRQSQQPVHRVGTPVHNPVPSYIEDLESATAASGRKKGWKKMREDDSNWFSKWEEELPSPEELMPLSQTLITPDLAMAFDIRNSNSQQTHQHQQPPPPPPPPPLVQTTPSSQPHNNNSVEFDSGELGGGGAASGDEPARTLKRPRLVWTPQLHKRFVDAVAHLGIKNAVPKTIMQLMSVDGLTRENVASHLQKYRLYLKRMQGLSSNGGGGGGGGIPAAVDPATDHLFASSPVPAHFVNLGRPTSDHFLPFVPVAALQQHHHHHHQQMAAVAGHPQFHPQYRPMGHFGSPPNGQFELPFLSRQSQQPVHRVGTPVHNPVPSYIEDLESATAASGRKVLTLFPTGDD